MPTAENPGGPVSGPKKKIPTWYYVVGGIALVGVYYLYSKSKANSAAAAATTPAAGAGSSTGTAASSYGNAGDLAALAPYLAQTSSGSGVTSTAAYTAPTGETVTAGGYGPPQNTAGGSVVGPNGQTFTNLSTIDQINEAIAAQTPLYYQPTPGVFMPANNYQTGQSYAAGNTPLFISSTSSS